MPGLAGWFDGKSGCEAYDGSGVTGLGATSNKNLG